MPAPAGWYRRLALVSAVALCIRVAYVLVSKRHAAATGDAFYFHLQADLLVTGKGWFIDPWAWSVHHTVVQSAYHPPLWTLVLALPAALGAQSFLSQLLWSCVVGTAAVAVTGLAGRQVAGPRAGLLAAAIAAVYPNYWLNDGSGLSETLVLLLVAAVVLVSYQLWRSPSLVKGALLGALCALAALTRAELALLVPLVLVPVCLVARRAPVRRRVAVAAMGIAVALVTVAPWIGFNLSRFDHVELISSEFGTGLASADCNSTFYGPFIGYWSFACQARRHCGVVPVQADEAEADARCRSIGWAYIRRQSSQIPVVALARVGREFGFYAPVQQLNLDGGFPRLMSFETAALRLGRRRPRDVLLPPGGGRWWGGGAAPSRGRRGAPRGRARQRRGGRRAPVRRHPLPHALRGRPGRPRRRRPRPPPRQRRPGTGSARHGVNAGGTRAKSPAQPPHNPDPQVSGGAGRHYPG